MDGFPAEEELRLESGILRQVLHSSPAGILVYDSSANCVIANESAARISGGTVDQMLGQNYRALESWRRDGLLAVAEEALTTRTTIARVFRSVSTFGKEVAADFRFSAFDYGGKLYLLVIILDIADRLRAESEERAMADRLARRALNFQAADKEMESFFYAVTHDLRAPLRAIDGFAKMVEEDEGERLSEDGRRLVETIRENATRMGTLIEELFIFARLSKADIEKVPLEMGELVLAVYRETVPEAARQRIDFVVSALPAAMGDLRLSKQIWTNLISNAVKFSTRRERAHIEVTGERRGHEIIYCIRDDGVGFDMRYAGKLFGIFQRLHPAREFAGSGMGLAIVQRAVIRQGGRAWAEGEVGKGAAFSFALPLSDE